MSTQTEKAFKAMHEYLDKNAKEDMSEEELNNLIQEFMEDYNSNIPAPVTEKTAKTSEDYVELAEMTDDPGKAGIYAKKALKLNPDNLDAERILIDSTSNGIIDALRRFERAIKHGDQVMKKQGYMDDEYIGDYWGVLETRPYIRLRKIYLELLVECAMYGVAAIEAESIIRFNETDNTGARYTLMHLYACLEDEDKAIRLYEQYGDNEEAMLILPLSILYYKKKDLANAEKYLRIITKKNKDVKKFIKAYINGELDRYVNNMDTYAYRPYTIDELITELLENSFLIENVPTYFIWADEVLNKKR